MKNVLVVTYSQSGQLDQIVSNIISGFSENIKIHRCKLKPKPEFPFPWKGISFWDAMPESVELIPSELEKPEIDELVDYDFVILGYPIWFLSPPIPLTTFFKSAIATSVLKGKPVLTVIGARNMWVGAQEQVKAMIVENGGKPVGNIVLTDRHQNLPSVVTIIYWMTTGKKDRYLGIFPKPGVSDRDIEEADRFGPIISFAIKENKYDDLQDNLLKLEAVRLKPDIVSMEEKAKRIFGIWSKFIRKKGGPGAKERIPRLKMFSRYLLFIIFVVSPIASLVFYLTYPLFFIRIGRKMRYYKQVDLKVRKK